MRPATDGAIPPTRQQSGNSWHEATTGPAAATAVQQPEWRGVAGPRAPLGVAELTAEVRMLRRSGGVHP